jgi:hypothetical protein
MSATLDAPLVPMPAGTPPVPSGIPTSTVTDPPTFRLHFPAFADTTRYPDPTVQFFIDMATVMCSPGVWCNLQQMGVELMTAHFLAMQQYAMQGGTGPGMVPGMASGVRTSKSVSKVSVGYDASVTAMEGWGPWNYTIYGQQYAWYAQLVGTGGFEMLGFGNELMAGLVWTWARGVMMTWGS